MSNKILNLDLSKDPIMPAIVYGRVGDDRLQTVTVNLTRRDEVADLTGYDITFEGTTYNGQTKVFDADNVSYTAAGLKKGTFDYTFPNMAFAVAGKYEQAYFSIVKDGKRDSTADFEIYVDGNADIDAPEAETIITEYNKLVAELKRLQSLAINEMNKNYAAVQERVAELEAEIIDMRKQIEQALTDFQKGNFWTKEESFNKEESSANVINQIIGTEVVRITFTTDFSNKQAGSLTQNANFAKYLHADDLPAPSAFGGAELTNVYYELLSALDARPFLTTQKVEGKRSINLYAFNIIEAIKDRFGEDFFEKQGLNSITDQVRYARQKVKRLNGNLWCFGSSPDGYRISIEAWSHIDKKWGYQVSNTQNTESKLSRDMSNMYVFIDDEGIVYLAAYSEQLNMTGSTRTSVDYANMEITLELSASEIIDYRIAAYHGQNLATKEEALAGESNEKIMTPLRVADVISTLGSGGNAVASSEEALAGIENTKIMSALRVKEVFDARDNTVVSSNVFSAAFMRSGQISFMRHGLMLVVNGSATVKTAQAALTNLFIPDLGGKVPLNNAGTILAISDKAPYSKSFFIDANGGNFRTLSALEVDEYLVFSGSIMLEP